MRLVCGSGQQQKENEADLVDLPAEVRHAIVAHPVEDLGEVLAHALRGASYREGRLFFGTDEAETGSSSPSLRH